MSDRDEQISDLQAQVSPGTTPPGAEQSAAALQSTSPAPVASPRCVIKVLGVGGCGCNVMSHFADRLTELRLTELALVALNTDAAALSVCRAPTCVQLGKNLTAGLGSGCDPNQGRLAAQECLDEIKELVRGTDLIFVVAGMGGGTGTGAAPVIAGLARQSGALTVGVATMPFNFEGRRRTLIAERGVEDLLGQVDTLIVVDNNQLLKSLGPGVSVRSAFEAVDETVINTVNGVAGAIVGVGGFINLDFADMQTVMRGRGRAVIGIGHGKGPNLVEEAVRHAIFSPLMQKVDISKASGLIVNVKVSPSFPLNRWEEVCSAVHAYAAEDADCKFGMKLMPDFAEDEIEVTVIMTGLNRALDELAAAPARMR
ncbi:MAG: cell division protein FtsZ [Succinivibrio sp.]|nr:cell division protein FtsZ [Succinivibrio sp.]